MNLFRNFLGKNENKTADQSSRRSGQAYQASTSASRGPQIYVLPYPPPPGMYSQSSAQTGYLYQNRKETNPQTLTQSEQNDKNSNEQPRESGQTNQQPTQPGYQQHAQSGYPQPAQPGYQQPPQSGYQQPTRSGYQQPTPSGYQQPTQSGYQHPTQSGYQQSTQRGNQQPHSNKQPRESGQTNQQPGYQQPAQSGYPQPTQSGNQQPTQPGNQQQPQGQPPPNGQYAYVYPGQPASAKDSPTYRRGPWRRESQEESTLEGWESFQEQKVRSVFVRKVYAILMIQLLFTLGIIALFVFEPNVKKFVQENQYLYYMALAIFIAVMLGIACCENLRRKFPTNIILLTIFTMAMSYMMGTISGVYDTEAVFMAIGITAAVCLLVSIFSFHTKFDFTTCGGILCILLLVLVLFGVIAIFIPSKVMVMIYSALGAVVFTLYLAYDTQMIMGGKSIEISPEEYVLAAMQLYIDITYIFIHLLMLIGVAQQ